MIVCKSTSVACHFFSKFSEPIKLADLLGFVCSHLLNKFTAVASVHLRLPSI